ncbi:phytoene desaturase family protein [Syntrophomonas curvata]
MTQKYEVIVAGAGHNGLIVAAYLAKAGVKVLVVEGQDIIGGGVMSKEGLAAPGFVTDMASVCHGFIQPNPVLKNDELELKSKYGLEYITPEKQVAVVFPDDRAIIFHRDVDKTCQSIAQFSEKDADAYRKFYDLTSKQLDMLTAGLYSPTPRFGAFSAALEGTQEGRDLLHAMLISGNDIANEWFEDDHTLIACNRFVSENMMDPRVDGSALNLYLFIPVCHKFGWPLAVGGSGALSQSLGRCIIDHGGEIRTSSWVKKFKIEAGECKGVILESGEEILATKAVVTNFSIKQLDERMLGAENVTEHYSTRVKNLCFQEYQAMLQGYALNEAPSYKAGKDVNESFLVEFAPDTMLDFNKEFDSYSYGQPWTTSPLCMTLTRWDTSRAPAGKHTLYLYHYEPYNLAGGAQRWDEIKEQVADEILNNYRKRTTNMGSENIIGRWISSPLDKERRNPAWIQGNFNHIGSQLIQQYGNRPFPEVQDYRLPVEKLYLCGPSTYPGPGVIGGGRAAVQVVMEDLGIDFDDVVG